MGLHAGTSGQGISAAGGKTSARMDGQKMSRGSKEPWQPVVKVQ
jgi:hypothetical protein